MTLDSRYRSRFELENRAHRFLWYARDWRSGRWEISPKNSDLSVGVPNPLSLAERFGMSKSQHTVGFAIPARQCSANLLLRVWNTRNTPCFAPVRNGSERSSEELHFVSANRDRADGDPDGFESPRELLARLVWFLVQPVPQMREVRSPGFAYLCRRATLITLGLFVG